MSETMKHLDLFTGIGGFSLGAKAAGMETVGHAEIDKFACQLLEDRFPGIPNLGSVTDIEGDTNVEIITAGSPCQDYSTAGRRAGTAGAKSGLIAHTFRLIDECEAEWVVIENVPGLLSSNGGRDFGAVLGTLADLGMEFAWRVLDAQEFGVPHRRRRVFIVGHSGGGDGPREVLSVPERVPGGTASDREDRCEHPPTSNGSLGERRYAPLTVNVQAVFPGVAMDVAHCMKAGARSIGVLDGGRVRFTTPLECERLQGFPDGWTKNGQSDTQRYRQLGNAVAVPVVSAIMKRIAERGTDNE